MKLKIILAFLVSSVASEAIHAQGFDNFYEKNFTILAQKSSTTLNGQSYSNTLGAGVSANVYEAGKGGRSFELSSPAITDIVGLGKLLHHNYSNLVQGSTGYNVISNDKNILSAGYTISLIFGEDYTGKTYFLEPGTYLRYDRILTSSFLVRAKNVFLHPVYFKDYSYQHFSSITTVEVVHSSGFFVGVNSWNMIGAPVSRLDFTAGCRLKLFNK